MKKLRRNIVVTAAILTAFTIALGAFGAHGLEKLVSQDAINTFETGVRYQMYHCLAMLIIGFTTIISESTARWVFRFFIFGIILFSGSIYFLALKQILPFSVSFLGPVTPLGGLLFIIGWLRLAYGLLTMKADN